MAKWKRPNEKEKNKKKRTKCPTLGGDIEIDNDIEARRRLAFIHCVIYISLYIYIRRPIHH